MLSTSMQRKRLMVREVRPQMATVARPIHAQFCRSPELSLSHLFTGSGHQKAGDEDAGIWGFVR
jgi:hypothetical protein